MSSFKKTCDYCGTTTNDVKIRIGNHFNSARNYYFCSNHCKNLYLTDNGSNLSPRRGRNISMVVFGVLLVWMGTQFITNEDLLPSLIIMVAGASLIYNGWKTK